MTSSRLVLVVLVSMLGPFSLACDVADEAAGVRSAHGLAGDPCATGGDGGADALPAAMPDASPAAAASDAGSAVAPDDEAVSGAFAAPNGSPSAPCTKDAPCDWKTAMHSQESTVVLMDGTYAIPAGVVWCVRGGKTVRAQHRWAAKVAFEGNAATTGDEDGACGEDEGFGFGLHGTLRGLEITAPARWSAIDAFAAGPGVRSRIENVLVHDVNTTAQEYSTYGNCVQQGALDVVDTDVVDSVVYRTGQRTGTDPIRGSSTLATCINYQAIYVQHETTVTNDLIVDHYGGFCVHGYKPTDVNDVVEKNTTIGCHQGAVILPIFPTNRVADNVFVRGRADTAGPQYGACITSYWGGTSDPARLANDVCRDNPHDAIYESATGTFLGMFLNTTADVSPVLVDPSDVVSAFDRAFTAADKQKVARALGVDRTKTGGAGFVLP